METLELHEIERDKKMIIYSEESRNIRDEIYTVLKDISKKKALRILDIGGGKNSFLKELVTDIIDLNIIEIDNENIKLHIGTFYDEMLWSSFSADEFDFISCTQTLEDLRDPQFLVSKISYYSKAGFISVPNQFQETSNIESSTWVGNYHHRYIFNFTTDGLIAFPKFAYINNNLNSNFIRILIFLINIVSKKKIMRYPMIRQNKKKYPRGYYPKGDDELSVIYLDEINLKYHNNDHSGKNPINSADILNEMLVRKFNKIDSSIYTKLSMHFK